jgi:hypothetical protein
VLLLLQQLCCWVMLLTVLHPGLLAVAAVAVYCSLLQVPVVLLLQSPVS